MSLLTLLATLLFGCIDQIDLTQGLPLPDGIVVSGRLLVGDDLTEAEVILQELFRFETSNRPDQIVTANVRVVNSDGQELSLAYRDGVYKGSIAAGDPAFRAEEGMNYHVQVTTREGANYTSKPEALLPKLEITSARAITSTVEVENGAGVIGNEPAMEYLITTPLLFDNGDPAYVRWLVNEYYALTDESTDTITGIKTCYIDLPFEGTKVKVVGNAAGVASLTDYSLGKNRISFRYAEGNYMEIRQEAISREAFDYYSQVNSIASRELSIFEAPGGPVVGNVSSVEGTTANVFGYFYVARPSVVRVPVTPAEAGNPVFACPIQSPMPPRPPHRCTDCLLASNNATTARPVWWEL